MPVAPAILREHLRIAARSYQLTLSRDARWVLVRDFALPGGYNARTTQVLVGIPPQYPLRPPGLWPHAFFVAPGLRVHGRAHPHVVEGRGPGWGRWAWLCVTRIDWRPGRDDLRRSLEVVRAFLSEPCRR